MEFDGDLFFRTFVTILVVMDPLGNVPIFLGLTRRLPTAEQHRAARIGAAAAGGIIVAFALAGRQLLEALGISLEALQVAGGLLLLFVALELLRGAEETDEVIDAANVAMVPLGTPLLAGPGAIAATMVYVGESDGPSGLATVVIALVLVVFVVYLALRFATLIAKLVGDKVILLLTRVLGLLTTAIAVQLIADAGQVWVRDGVS